MWPCNIFSVFACFVSYICVCSPLSARAALDADLSAILLNRVPRAYGEMPAHTGLFSRICPGSDAFDRVMKVKNAHLKPRAARPPPGS